MYDQMVEKYNAQGVVVLPDVFSQEEVVVLRREIDSIYENLGVERGRSEGIADLVTYPNLRHVIVKPEVLGFVRQLIGPDAVYVWDSAIHKGPGIAGWHRDNRMSDRFDPNLEDWNDDYSIVRVGIYLQDHFDCSGGLMIRIGSHIISRRATKMVLTALSHLKGKLGLQFLSYAQKYIMRFVGRPAYLNVRSGDVAFWSLRTTHSGGAKRLKLFPNFPLDPVFQKILPNFLFLGEKEERKVIFFAFAAPNIHYDRYMSYLKTRSYYTEKMEIDEAIFDEGVEFLSRSVL